MKFICVLNGLMNWKRIKEFFVFVKLMLKNSDPKKFVLNLLKRIWKNDKNDPVMFPVYFLCLWLYLR